MYTMLKTWNLDKQEFKILRNNLNLRLIKHSYKTPLDINSPFKLFLRLKSGNELFFMQFFKPKPKLLYLE